MNLAEVLKTDPKAKILVYAGYDHIHEGTLTDWKKMAQFFKEFTNIDPLTISQTRHVEQYYVELETDEVRTVNRFESFSNPLVALNNGKLYNTYFLPLQGYLVIAQLCYNYSLYLSICLH
ncbi:hypothetical protein [Sphingobacterium sp. xlx-130]|uniref:hypothetical protein n=1 Tax=Sphingobacterium sp. xlx-130 TaxID=2654323 RepID=UPI0013DAE294|nr:hypothetical protein [Sphingobacterium sp. xlx-130]